MGNNHWLKGLSGIFCLKKFFFLLGSHGLGHVQLWDLDHKEGRVSKSWCFQNVVLEKTLESAFDSKIKPFNPKRNQPWIFIGRTDAEVHLMWKANSLQKILILGKIEGKKKRGQQRMRWLDSITNTMDMNLSKVQESEEQGSLLSWNPRGDKELDMTYWLNNNNI